MANLSEARRLESGMISEGSHTHYWSGCGDGHHLEGIAIANFRRLHPSVIEITPVT